MEKFNNDTKMIDYSRNDGEIAIRQPYYKVMKADGTFKKRIKVEGDWFSIVK